MPAVTTPAAQAPDGRAATAAAERARRLAPAPDAFGRLAELAGWAAGVQGRCPPGAFRRPRVVVFAADHGVAMAGAPTAGPAADTATDQPHPPAHDAGSPAGFVTSVLTGAAPLTELADRAGATIRLVDVGLADEVPGLAGNDVRRGSRRADRADALGRDEADRAVAVGRAVAGEEIDAGADLLVTADAGTAATVAATALTALLTGAEPHALLGADGTDPGTWVRLAAATRDAARRGRAHLADPVALLAAVGGADIAATAGFLAEAALRRTPVVLDGLVSAAAALVAERLCTGAPAWWLAGHRSAEPAQAAALEALDLAPVLDLGLRSGWGTGPVLAVPVLQAAIAVLGRLSGDPAGPG